MASVTVNLTAYFSDANKIQWDGDVSLGSTFDAEQEDQELSQLLLRNNVPFLGQINILLFGTNNRFTPAFEATGRIILTASDGETLEVMIANADMTEPYRWIPTNSAEVLTFIAHVRTLTDTSATLTLTDDPATSAPAVPAEPTITGLQRAQATVNWIPPDGGGLIIDHYDLQWREGTTGPWTTIGGLGGLSRTLTGLDFNTTYQAQVQANNSEGDSGYSSPVTFTTLANQAPNVAINTVGATVATGETISLDSTITDPDDATNTLTILWSGGVGSFASPNQADTEWTAPATPQSQTLQVRATDPHGLSSTRAITFTVAQLLSLSDFNDSGLDVETAALLEASAPGTSGNNFYVDSSRGGTGTPIEGELGVGTGETVIDRLRRASTANLTLNDSNSPVVLDFNTYFGTGGAGADLSVYLQTTSDGLVSFTVASTLLSAGGNWLNVTLPTAARTLLDNLATGDRFIFALARTAPHPPALTTGDWDGTGYQPPVVLALLEAAVSGEDLTVDPVTPVSGSLVVASNLTISKVSRPSATAVRLFRTNDSGGLSVYFDNEGSPVYPDAKLSIVIDDADRSQVPFTIGSTGFGFNNWTLDNAGQQALLGGISTGDRFVLAIAEPTPPPSTSHAIAANFPGAAGTLAVAVTKVAARVLPAAATFPGLGGNLAAAVTKRSPATRSVAANFPGVDGSLVVSVTKVAARVFPAEATFPGTGGGLTAAVTKVASLLALSDFDQTGLDIVFAGLIIAGADTQSGGTAVYVSDVAGVPWTATGTLVDGNLDYDGATAALTRLMYTATAIRFNDNQTGDTGSLDDFLNMPGMRVFLTVDDGGPVTHESAYTAGAAGGNFYNLTFDDAPTDAAFRALAVGDRFIFALARAAPPPPITLHDVTATFPGTGGSLSAAVTKVAARVLPVTVAFPGLAGSLTAAVTRRLAAVTHPVAATFGGVGGSLTVAVVVDQSGAIPVTRRPKPAVPLVHLGWETQVAVSGHAVAALNGLYSLGPLDGELTAVRGAAPKFVVTYDDGTDEWIILTVDGVSRSQRAIADGDTGTFADFSNTAPTGDIEYALAIVSGELTMTANGQVLNIGTLGDASGGTLTLYAEPDTTKTQRVQYRSATEDFDWYADVPFLRLDAAPRVPLVDSRSSVTSGKDSLRALNPFRVPDGNVQLRITAGEFLAEAWQVDFPIAIVEAYTDGAGAVIYRSQLVGRVETPRYEETHLGYYVSLRLIGNTASLLSNTIETAHHAIITTRNAIIEVMDEADWPTLFRDLRITSLNVPVMTDWWVSSQSPLNALQMLLDTAGPPSQMYEDRKGRLAILGLDWVLNVTRPTADLSAASGIRTYESRRNTVDPESQINVAVQQVSTWQESAASQELWTGQNLVVPNGLSVTVEARFRSPVVSVDAPTASDYTITGSGTLTAAVQNVKAFQADLVLSASGGDVTVTAFSLKGTHLTNEQRIRVPAENAASVAEIGPREWRGRILPSLSAFSADGLLRHLVRSYSDSIGSSIILLRAEDNYAIIGYLEHLHQANSVDRQGNVFDGFIRQMTRRWTPEGTWLTVELEQDAGVLQRDGGVFRFGVSTLGGNDFLWI